MSPRITIIIPYYAQPAMLHEQLTTWDSYPAYVKEALQLVIVDDGSPVPVLDALKPPYSALWLSQQRIALWRVMVDIPWNRGQARNIGARHANTGWIMQMDIDHCLPVAAAKALVEWFGSQMPMTDWYRFRRMRVGAADHTRNKDAIPRGAAFGEIKPHIDSYLCPKNMYWEAGGYNEDFSGCLGGGSPFLSFLTAICKPTLAPEQVYLTVHTTHATKDASADLDRTPGEYTRRRAALEKAGKLKGHDPCRQPYERVL